MRQKSITKEKTEKLIANINQANVEINKNTQRGGVSYIAFRNKDGSIVWFNENGEEVWKEKDKND